MKNNGFGTRLSEERLVLYGENTAKDCTPNGSIHGKGVSKRTIEAIARIRELYEKGLFLRESETIISQALEWLTDNFYIAEREGRDGAHAMASLKKLSARDGDPVIFVLAESYLKVGTEITEQRILNFLIGVLKVANLTERELWGFFSALKCAVLLSLEEKTSKIEELGGSGEEPPKELAETIGNLFCGLRFLQIYDTAKLLQQVNPVETLLMRDPSGDYPKMAEESRAFYRRTLSHLAENCGIEQRKAAEQVLHLAEQGKNSRQRHVGYYILERPLGKEKGNMRGRSYFECMTMLLLLLTAFLTYLSGDIRWFTVFLLPAWETARGITDWFMMGIVPPDHIPRMNFERGVPEEGKTLCMVSALTINPEGAEAVCEKLEKYHSKNRNFGEYLVFGVLVDLKDSKEEISDADGAILSAASKVIDRLNAKQDGKYVLFTRKRVYNEREKAYMGWERKRGGQCQLIRYLNGRDSDIKLLKGKEEWLTGIRYLMTLDCDTNPSIGCAANMVGAMLHPLNHAVVRDGRVVAGYGVLQPRVTVELEDMMRSAFSRLFAGSGGIDPYGSAASDIYQDVFREGIFTGKGILDIRTYEEVLDGVLPQNRILSHDLLEGAYLRAGFLSDTEYIDGYPYKAAAYFDRQHRWIRGDWQLLGYFSSHVPDEEGKMRRNPISALSKYKIFDNLRRSVTPISIFILLFIGAFYGGRLFAAAVLAAFLALGAGMITDFCLRVLRGRNTFERYHSPVKAGIQGDLTRILVKLIFVPFEALISVSAILLALYRQFISKRFLLRWVTAAESEEACGSGIVYYCRKMVFCFAAGGFALAFSAGPAGRIAGIFWLSAPFLAKTMSKKTQHKRPPSEKEKLFLQTEAAKMWSFFEDLLSAGDNYLPPDNWQEQPASGTAHRTSPTNIGLCALCILSAMDLKLCSEERGLLLIERLLSSTGKLQKWNGHLYNWYDTETLRPLLPRFVSTVDSGNLAACLVALREGLYEIKNPKARGLAAIADELWKNTDFTVLYDAKRRLFSIGWDCEKDELSSGVYDLLASEVRTASYLAVARGDVPKRHWQRLGRALISEDGYKGMVSWTGTMFEYLMPNLVLPCPKGSLLRETAEFAIYCQRKYAEKNNVPMGVSESGFYAFDPGLNYRYKAHGVPKLGLKTGLAQEIVVSPYSAFLALLIDRAEAIRTLEKLKQQGAYGKYGFYEAVDYTKERLPWGQSSAIVRSFMVHHVGMSLLAVHSVLTEGKMQQRFMKDKTMAAYKELLEERLPVGASTLQLPEQKKREKHMKTEQTGFKRERQKVEGFPKVNLLSNGGYHLLLCDTGLSQSRWGQTSLTTQEGIRFFLKDGQTLLSLYPAPFYDQNVSYSSAMDFSYGKTTMQSEDYLTSVSSCVCGSDKGELREVEVKNLDESDREVELCIYFEPVLAPMGDYDAHQAFSKLFLQTDVSGDRVLIHRRRRTAAESMWVAFQSSQKGFQFDTSRQLAFGRGGFKKLEDALQSEPVSRGGDVLDPCVLGRLRFVIKAGETKVFRFALAVGDTRGAAESTAERMLNNASVSDRQIQTAKVLGLSGEGAAKAMELYGKVLFQQKQPGKTECRFSQKDLWPFGISGDLPIVYGRLNEDPAKNEDILKQWVFLYLNGGEADLVLAVSDGGDYRQQGREEILHILKAIGGEQLIGIRGGIHIINASQGSREDQLLRYVSVLVLFEKNEIVQHDAARGNFIISCKKAKKGSYGFGWSTDGSFHIDVEGRLPQLAFSHVLANKLYGYLATDSGIGFMWYLNSRENKINRWQNDPIATDGPECIEVHQNGEKISVFAKEDGYCCKICYGLGYAEYSKTIDGFTLKTTVFIAEKSPVRVMMLELSGKIPEKLTLHWENELILGVKPADSRYIVTHIAENGALCAENPYDSDFEPYVYAQMTSGVPETRAAGNRIIMDTEFTKDKTKLVLVSGAVAREHALGLLHHFTTWETAEEELARVKDMWISLCKNRQIQLGNASMEHYINHWALYQVTACRVFARTSLYQCGGAYGFRDQLQDVCALISAAPELTKTQLLRAACHQFIEGDVLHWWHYTKAGERGVRTRCSDDLLWLPYVLALYVTDTADYDLLSIKVAYLYAPVLGEHEHERYFQPERSSEKSTMYDHAVRAIRLVLNRGTGAHGLLLMGEGDWNDGMNLVGAQGKGESQWLTFFFVLVARYFLPLCEKMGDEDFAKLLRERCISLMEAAEQAWDGSHYLRGYYDNGDTLGSSIDEECRIDSIAQSFAVLTGAARAEDAVREAIEKLFDREHQLAMLFTPAFEKSPKNPGYIKGYLPGVRENGGQYTHGGVWLAMGALESGLCVEGYAILNALLPENHPHDVYKVEPYVLAADVYTNPQHIGRGGWTNYTGAASWYYRTVFESLFGIKKCGDKISVVPHLPESVENAQIELHHKKSVYYISIQWGEKRSVTVDGQNAEESFVLEGDGEHQVVVILQKP